jgi:hypothetical protein
VRLGPKEALATLCVVVLATASVAGLLVTAGRQPGVDASSLTVTLDLQRRAAASAPLSRGLLATPPTTSPVPAAPPTPLVAAPAPAPPARPAPAPVQVETRAARSDAVRTLPPGHGGTWAVVLGVDDYGGSGDLHAGVADAIEVESTLLDAHVPGENILALHNRDVTPRTIQLAADWLVDHVGEDGLAVFVWAGHIRALDHDTEALVTSDGSTVTDATLADHLRGLRARRSWFLIAGCYGGGFTEILGPGRLLTAASDEGSEAYENSFLGHSYVVEYVVRRGIHRRESTRVVSGAVSWAQAAIRRDHPGREPVGYVSGPVEPFVLGPDPTPTPAEARAAA